MEIVEPIRDLKDIRKIEEVLKQQGLRDLLFFLIGINCGLRISDILNLNVEDIKNKTHISIIEKKTGKRKRFPLNANLWPSATKISPTSSKLVSLLIYGSTLSDSAFSPSRAKTHLS